MPGRIKKYIPACQATYRILRRIMRREDSNGRRN